MNAHTDAMPKGLSVIEKDGRPEYVVVPYAEFIRIFGKAEALIPHNVVSRVVDGASILKAWREHLDLTQADLAARLGVTQAAYSQLESSPKLRPSSRRKLAAALGLSPLQLVEGAP
jgi:DNA-binding XRE family transcriptional regulator